MRHGTTEGTSGVTTEKNARTPIKRTPRPRDRRQQIVSASRRLFHAHGFNAVSAAQIATEVGITAGALYRHFTGKQDLLVHALIDALDAAAVDVTSTSGELGEVIHALTGVAGTARELGGLWTRETRHLDEEHLAVVRRHFVSVFGDVRQRIAEARPDVQPLQADLLTWTTLAILTSISYHRVEIGPDVVELLEGLALAGCATPLSDVGEPVAVPNQGLQRNSRREAILVAASALFAARGFQRASLDDVGREVGISGAGVYRYYSSKAEVLSAVVERGAAALQQGLTVALSGAVDEADALARLLDAYISFASDNPDLVTILLAETDSLPAPDRRARRQEQREYVAEWQRLLEAVQPDLGPDHSRVVAHAVLTVINDAVRTAPLRDLPTLAEDLGRIGRVLVGLSDRHVNGPGTPGTRSGHRGSRALSPG